MFVSRRVKPLLRDSVSQLFLDGCYLLSSMSNKRGCVIYYIVYIVIYMCVCVISHQHNDLHSFIIFNSNFASNNRTIALICIDHVLASALHIVNMREIYCKIKTNESLWCSYHPDQLRKHISASRCSFQNTYFARHYYQINRDICEGLIALYC